MPWLIRGNGEVPSVTLRERTDPNDDGCNACEHDMCSCPCVVCAAHTAAHDADPTLTICKCYSCTRLRRDSGIARPA